VKSVVKKGKKKDWKRRDGLGRVRGKNFFFGEAKKEEKGVLTFRVRTNKCSGRQIQKSKKKKERRKESQQQNKKKDHSSQQVIVEKGPALTWQGEKTKFEHEEGGEEGLHASRKRKGGGSTEEPIHLPMFRAAGWRRRKRERNSVPRCPKKKGKNQSRVKKGASLPCTSPTGMGKKRGVRAR